MELSESCLNSKHLRLSGIQHAPETGTLSRQLLARWSWLIIFTLKQSNTSDEEGVKKSSSTSGLLYHQVDTAQHSRQNLDADAMSSVQVSTTRRK